MNHELNAQVAEEVMGWQRHNWLHPAMQKTVYCPTCGNTKPKAKLEYADEPFPFCFHLAMPDYSGSLDAAWEMEEELGQRGLYVDYTVGLLRVVSGRARWPESYHAVWELIRATPEQRCRAALEAVREK